jgi:hypothetical protein
MLYLFELMANASLAAPNQGTQRSFRDGHWNTGSFTAFRMDKDWGHQNGPTRSGTLGQANAKAYTATKWWRNCCDACRDVFSWHDPRQRPVCAEN